LLYRYAELIDAGRFEEIADGIFAHAKFVVGPAETAVVDARGMLEMFRATTIRYPDGSPHTKHVVTNPIVDVDESSGTATCRSYYTVFQQTDTLPFQAILSGRYHDRFERVDGQWRFSQRDYTLVDLVGDVSQHVRFDIKAVSR